MTQRTLDADQIAAITAYVDVEAAPPARPTAVLIFGTNQPTPAIMAAERHRQGLAPLIIATGGINRHNGIIEGREFHRLLREHDVPEDAIRYEDRSANTWQNVEFSEPYLREAIEERLPITVACKWYHRRAIHMLHTVLPALDGSYAMTWEPLYGGTPVTRTNWPDHTDGRRRILREWQEVPRRVAEGSLKDTSLANGMWRPRTSRGVGGRPERRTE